MNPETIAKANTEHAHQAAFFCWLSQSKHIEPRFEFAFAIPNGGERNQIVATRLKAEGVRRGVPDVFLPIPRVVQDEQGNWSVLCGLWIEFKAPGDDGKAKGRLKPEQDRFRQYLISQNYSHFVAYDYLQAKKAVLEYLGTS